MHQLKEKHKFSMEELQMAINLAQQCANYVDNQGNDKVPKDV